MGLHSDTKLQTSVHKRCSKHIQKNAETKFVVVFGLNCCLKYSSDAFLVVKADYEVTLCNIMFYII
jgi:hypothetical protein